MWTGDEIYVVVVAKHLDLTWRPHLVGVFGEIAKQKFLVEFHFESMRPDA